MDKTCSTSAKGGFKAHVKLCDYVNEQQKQNLYPVRLIVVLSPPPSFLMTCILLSFCSQEYADAQQRGFSGLSLRILFQVLQYVGGATREAPEQQSLLILRRRALMQKSCSNWCGAIVSRTGLSKRC